MTTGVRKEEKEKNEALSQRKCKRHIKVVGECDREAVVLAISFVISLLACEIRLFEASRSVPVALHAL